MLQFRKMTPAEIAAGTKPEKKPLAIKPAAPKPPAPAKKRKKK